jgi:hypothetical protein
MALLEEMIFASCSKFQAGVKTRILVMSSEETTTTPPTSPAQTPYIAVFLIYLIIISAGMN